MIILSESRQDRRPCRCARGGDAARCARVRPRGRRAGLEPERDDRAGRPGCARRGVAPGNGARSGVRRRQRDRPRAPAVPRLAAREALGFARCGCGDCGISRARRNRARAEAGPRSALCIVVGRHPRRSDEGGRHPRRRDGCSGDDRRADERWALRLSGLSDGHHAGPVAAGPAHVRQRPVRLDQERDAVPDQGRVAVPLAWTVPSREPEIRSGLRGGEGRRLRDEHDAYRRSDQRRSLLGRESAGHLDPHRSHAVTARGVVGGSTTPATSRCCT